MYVTDRQTDRHSVVSGSCEAAEESLSKCKSCV